MALPPVRSKILVIENRLDALHAGIAGLSQIGYEVSTAGSGTEGLNLALNEEFDLVAINLDLPGANGFEIASYLREDFRYDRTPFVFVSDGPNPETQRRMAEFGPAEFLVKPFDTSNLILLIVSLIRPVRS